jgi:hypothetical protein
MIVGTNGGIEIVSEDNFNLPVWAARLLCGSGRTLSVLQRQTRVRWVCGVGPGARPRVAEADEALRQTGAPAAGILSHSREVDPDARSIGSF